MTPEQIQLLLQNEVKKRYQMWKDDPNQYTQGRLHEAHELLNLFLVELKKLSSTLSP